MTDEEWSEKEIWDVPQEPQEKKLLFDSWLAVLLKPFGYGVRPIAVLLDFDIYNIHRGNKKYIQHVKITTYRRAVVFRMWTHAYSKRKVQGT